MMKWLVTLCLAALLAKAKAAHSLLEYIQDSSDAIDCSDKCDQDAFFVPALKNSDGTCPQDPSSLDMADPISLSDVCRTDTVMMETFDAHNRSMGNKACQILSDKTEICGFCASLLGTVPVGPFAVNCTGLTGPFHPVMLGTFCPSFGTPFCQ